MSDAANSTTDKLMQDLKVVVGDAEALLKATAGSAGEGASELRQKVQTSLAQARRDLRHLEEAAIERARAAGRAADDYVHDNPWKAIGAAAGVGLIIGLLISRR
ncbi:DUF883 family protein [Rivibacter subsaxonicus]|uniref:ElaB/YqjD/DUF883 family membrane-anchored ribosome-binding protein n=1 Tax=Rivibacter subsaxonicus TaxID=457575 RepID=A0A4Q7W156_9BURK|nr:DUF883 family protein [Rivibacter subsaxonicus]RZU02984.1 ElaB/YqjD/DUF883 family membrane-anchored ribosome-binding protein [Rivibacter subsaxonicus]